MTKILLALSGGVDSAAAAILLQEQGYEVIGATMTTGHGDDAEAAAVVAASLGIPHHTVDMSQSFRELIIADFISSYEHGLTPNPCVICNPLVKFAFLQALADDLGIEYMATGHYAGMEKTDGEYFITKAACNKDQSYMLYRLNESLLPRLIFPLNDYDKSHIRAIAERAGLSNHNKPDSQDICFIPQGDYRHFLSDNAAVSKPGNFIDTKGNILGAHSGITCYTIGQRKGLGIALGSPRFVCSINGKSGDVVLGTEDDLYAAGCELRDIRFRSMLPQNTEIECEVKLRYKSPPVPCRLIIENDTAKLDFVDKQKSVTPGQSAVCYIGSQLIGGGIIK